ncbi:MAG: bifunctional DNA-formamidopyrimidine glycosylase/DNA-(apurinic or apyrimidinic site) lyase [Candidatus Shapirobacteria bacterium]|nr:bifunctional DNA-formamidopyrimidine glycosylase/DNA-(apurinic or apyrimidinic site) lyase [Candidatus Shapirobacteria bacterium]
MPELPEVETIRKDLEKFIVGYKVLDVETNSSKQIQPSLAIVKKAIVGMTIKKVQRRAKILQIFFSNGSIIIIHLKLTGRLLFRNKKDPADLYQHITLSLSGDKELRFADARKFGWFKLIKDEKDLKELLKKFGPEPLSDLNLPIFQKILSTSSRPIKIILMDQEKISGVGNIYANEALFMAGINPQRPANKITKKETEKLYQSLEKVLQLGLRYRGASDNDYLDIFGHKGSYQEHFLVYGRQGKPCPNGVGLIKRIKIGGRGTFYCPQCQK